MTLMDGIAWAALVVAAVAALFTGLQWKASERSADAAEKSANSAEGSAQATKVLAEVGQRAWLVVNPLDIESLETGPGQTPSHFYFFIENAGKSPAIDLRVFYDVQFTNVLTYDPDEAIKQELAKGILGPGGKLRQYVDGSKLVNPCQPKSLIFYG